MFVIGRTFFIALLFIAVSAFGKTSAPVISTDKGPVLGIQEKDLLSFKGIPYSAPPVGDLRWRPPQATKAWKKTLNATKYGAACPQNADLGAFSRKGGKEDCLYLNVYVSKSALDQKKKLPVLFWIHGGSLWVGAGSDYGAGTPAIEGKAVVVTINYRLGMFGFFSHPSIDKEGHDFANYGFMDQIAALEWVNKNISEFGGDPNNISIAGESSGGDSVFALMISPKAAGKFHQGIAMSAGAMPNRFPHFGSSKPLDYAQNVGRNFSKELGCGEDKNPSECLRKISVENILKNQTAYLINMPIIDGTVIPMEPIEALKKGKFHHVPLINGTTLNEGTFFAAIPENATGIAMDEIAYAKAIEKFYGSEIGPKVLKEYPVTNYITSSEAYAAAVTSSLFSCGVLSVNKILADQIPVYMYEFSDRTAPSYMPDTTYPLGASHTFEIPYLFPEFRGVSPRPVTLNQFQKKLADKMVDLWSNFSNAKEHEADWPRFDADKENFLTFSLPNPRIMEKSYSKVHHCEFWDKTGIYHTKD